MAKATLINTDLCLGCNAYTVECKRNNDLPVGQSISWTRIDELETGTFPNTKAYFIKQSCKHCTEAACVEVCPVGAASKPDGVHVVINQEECIGCGYCAMSCPFGTPHFGEPKGASQKCSYCYGTKIDGESTACEIACPFGAITSMIWWKKAGSRLLRFRQRASVMPICTVRTTWAGSMFFMFSLIHRRLMACRKTQRFQR